MNLEKFIGFKLDEVKPILERENIKYNIIEVWDTKKTKMGNDVRVINIREKDIIDLYVAYF